MLYKILFGILFIFFAYYVFRIKSKQDYTNRQKLTASAAILAFLVFAIHANAIYLAIPTPYPEIPPLPDLLVVRIQFFTLLGIGIIILLFAWFKLGSQRSFGSDKNQLEVTGIYKYSRNPQLIGYGSMLFSFVIGDLSYLTIIWFILYIIAAHFMIKSEEEFLTRKYGEAYLDYCRKTPRLL